MKHVCRSGLLRIRVLRAERTVLRKWQVTTAIWRMRNEIGMMCGALYFPKIRALDLFSDDRCAARGYVCPLEHPYPRYPAREVEICKKQRGAHSKPISRNILYGMCCQKWEHELPTEDSRDPRQVRGDREPKKVENLSGAHRSTQAIY